MTKTVQEGLAKLVIDETAETESFYNPIQEFNRDVTVTVLRQFVADRLNEDLTEEAPPPQKRAKTRRSNTSPQEPIRILDALSASGLRALRFALEVDNVEHVIANDFSESSVENIKRNIKANGLDKRVTASYDDAKNVMMMHREPAKQFHVVDLDPYGTAAPFLNSAVQSVADGGLLMVTCTDMAVLCGNTPEACFLKYGATGIKHKSCHEVALRILLRSIESHANIYGRYIEPMLCMSIDYYIRVFVKVFTSPVHAKMSALKVAHVLACTGCTALDFQPIVKRTPTGDGVKFTTAILKSKMLNDNERCVHCRSAVHIGGPLYTAPIQNPEFLKRVLERLSNTPAAEALGTHERMLGVLTVISEELHDIPLYYVQDVMFSLVKSTCPKQSYYRSGLLNAGYRVSGTHCNPKGFKTDAPMTFILDMLRDVVKAEFLKVPRCHPATPGAAILRTEMTHTVDFTFNPASIPESANKNLVRFQSNHGKNWGPKSKAKGSVNSNLTAMNTTKLPLAEKDVNNEQNSENKQESEMN